MITLVTFHTWEKRFAANSRNDRRFVRVITSNRTGAITDITSYFSLKGVQIKSLNVKNDKEEEKIIIDFYLKISKKAPEDVIWLKGLEEIQGVISVESIK